MTDDVSQMGYEANVYEFSLPENQILPQITETRYLARDVDDEYIRELNSGVPVPIINTGKLVRRAREFTAAFPGHVLYAVKCNPDRLYLQSLYRGGVRRFDVASIGEVRMISEMFPEAKLYFMHPIKAPEAIREAYVNHGVRAFVLDYADELDKILHETNAAEDLELFVRIAVPKDNPGGGVATDFSSKFGAKPALAAELLRLCRPYCTKLGLSLHVGTQCPDPVIYSKAIECAAKTIDESGVAVDVLDVGGGFPADLEVDVKIPPIQAFTKTISAALKKSKLNSLEILCEAGRGLVACGGSLVVRVEGRKDDLLYLNDGTYGGMFEAGGSIGLPYPAHLIRKEERFSDEPPLKAFRFAGPTCDSVDMMKGPFMLPSDVHVGDWIRLEQLGAYGEVSRTNFNGFGTVQKIVIQEKNHAPNILEITQP